MVEAETRFLHLLKPIRDLTRNWEVDVAAHLGEYLEELDQTYISFDNGKTSMDFIEAALLIQGSACIYSRKVEHLYLLVYQTLDFLSNKKRNKQPSSVRESSRVADANFGNEEEEEEEEEFVSLDDIRDSSKVSVDMKKDQQPNAVNVIPLTPMSLVPPEEAEKKASPLFSRSRELLASRRDFRMNTCTPHATGALLLELPSLLPTGLCQGSPDTAAAAAAGGLSSRGQCLNTVGTPVQALSFSEEGGAAELDSDGGDNALGALEEDAGMVLAAKDRMKSLLPAKGYTPRKVARDPKTRFQELLDPWQSLDPFSDFKDKTFRKGMPLLVPHGLDVVGVKRKRKGSQQLQDFTSWFSADYNTVPGRRGAKRERLPFADLEELYQERVAAQRKLQRRRALPPLPHQEDLLEEERGGDYPEGADDCEDHENILPEGLEELGDRALDSPNSHDPGLLWYEELVRRNVEQFIADSQKYVQETGLSERVSCWHERMGLLLQEQEDHAPFDIHAYEVKLVKRCGRLGEWHSFASLVADVPPFEVCRYMLASLQLANDSVVELAQDAGLEQAVDTMRLRLLTTHCPQDRFLTFQPPSACP
ncbi:condensin-2 complex subunit H2 isoform 2-T4 [Podargus strigoides]